VIYDPDDGGVRRGDRGGGGGRGRRFENFLVIKTTDFHFEKTRFKLGTCTVFSLTVPLALFAAASSVCVSGILQYNAYRFVFRLHMQLGDVIIINFSTSSPPYVSDVVTYCITTRVTQYPRAYTSYRVGYNTTWGTEFISRRAR